MLTFFTLVDNKLSFVSTIVRKNPLDADKDGIYELIITAIDNDSQIISYPVSYRLVIPGTVSVKNIEQMVGLWDFYKGTTSYILEYLQSAIVNIHTYDNKNNCYDSEQSALLIKIGSKKGEFEEYNTNRNSVSFTYTAEILEGKLIRKDINNYIHIPKGEQVSIDLDQIYNNQCI